MKKWIADNRRLILASAAVFIFFAVISYLTPLAGDDWGYAYNGMKSDPISMTIQFYYSWSGRIFSELWGFVVAKRKWLWNILNPLLFTCIYFCIQKIGNKEKSFFKLLLGLFLILYVSDNLRMETYSWIMGTTYVVPLALCLIYLVFREAVYKANDNMRKGIFLISIFLNFYICLCMENIAAVLVFMNFLFIAEDIWNKKAWKQDAVLFAVSLIGLLIMRLSPGSAARLAENTDWNKMSLIEQLLSNLPNFLQYTFYDNKYLILILNFVLIYRLYRYDQKRIWRILCTLILGIASLFLVSNKINSLIPVNFLQFINAYRTSQASLYFNGGIWFIYIVTLFILILRTCKDELQIISLFLILIAGSSNLVMMISPIFGSRSSIYFYFFCVLLILMLIDSLSFKKEWVLTLLVLIMILPRGFKILNKYQMVNAVQQDRLIKIQYYLDHPQEKEVWLPRMPIYSVHSADIEEEDTYHMEVFKLYYGLSEDCTIHFYSE